MNIIKSTRKLRRKLGIKPGDRLVFDYTNEEEIRLKKQSPNISTLRGFLKNKISKTDLPVSLEEMKEGIQKGARRGRFGP